MRSSTFSAVMPSKQIEHGVIGIRQVNEQAVVEMQALGAIAKTLAQARFQGEPRPKVNAISPRTQEHQLPIPKRIAGGFKDDCAIGRHHAARGNLPAHEGTDVSSRVGVETKVVLQPVQAARGRRVARSILARKLPSAWPRSQVRLVFSPRQKGATRWHAFRRRNDHAIDIYFLDAPAVGSQVKRIADPAFVDEFLIQLADANAGKIVGGILPRIRNRAAIDQCASRWLPGNANSRLWSRSQRMPVEGH